MTETSTPLIDTDHAYEARINVGYSQIQNGTEFIQMAADYTPTQQKLLASEASLLSIDPNAQPDRFVEAHNALLLDTQAELNAQLPLIKASVIEKTSAYFGGEDKATQEALKELLTRRLAATQQVIVADALAYPKDVSGTFTAGVQDMWLMNDYSIRNGVEVMHIENPMEMVEIKTYKYGTWLNEATLESFRQTIMETDDVRYEPAVMVLHMLDEIKPGLRDRLVIAALDNSGPGQVFGEIEELLGPTCIDDVEELLSAVTNFAELETFKGEIVKMLPENMREKCRAILDQKQEEAFSWRSDYSEKRDKELAAAAEK